MAKAKIYFLAEKRGSRNSQFWTIQNLTLTSGFSKGKSVGRSIHSKEYARLIELLRRTRETNGLTQIQVAKKIKVSQSQFSKFERGELRLDVVQLRELCIALNTTLIAFVEQFEKDIAR